MPDLVIPAFIWLPALAISAVGGFFLWLFYSGAIGD